MSDGELSTDVLVVQADSGDSALGWAVLRTPAGEKRWRCVLGAGGVREDKVEGDAATPAGEFPLRRLYFRNDRLVLPKVALPEVPLVMVEEPTTRFCPLGGSRDTLMMADGLAGLVGLALAA